MTNTSYQDGLRTQIIMVSVSIVFSVIQLGVYLVHNKRVAEGKYTNGNNKALALIYFP